MTLYLSDLVAVNNLLRIGVGLVHHGEIIPNNSYISFSKINESLGALLCVTDKVDCCRGGGLDSVSPRGAWYYPNTSLLDGTIGKGTVYQERSTAMIRLLRGDTDRPPLFGLYRCIIPDKSNVNHSLYVGIYSANEGIH